MFLHFDKMRATIEVHHFFSKLFPILELKTPLNTDLVKTKRPLDKKSHSLGTQRELCKNQFLSVSDDFGLKGPHDDPYEA